MDKDFDIREEYKNLTCWKVYYNENYFIHEFFYKNELVYTYKVHENDTIINLEERLRFKINDYMFWRIKPESNLTFRLGSEKDKYIQDLFVNSLVLEYINIRFTKEDLENE